jgi:histone H3/H4
VNIGRTCCGVVDDEGVIRVRAAVPAGPARCTHRLSFTSVQVWRLPLSAPVDDNDDDAHTMDGAAHKLLESTTHRTLHANAFSRTSSQASLVLTDLLSRYLTLLLATSAKYAQHAGRTDLTARDGLSALEELGVNLEELSDYVSEGRELNRYAVYSARRLEDLRELKGQSLARPRRPAIFKY